MSIQDEHRHFLVGEIDAHYLSAGKPLFLSNLGKLFRDRFGDVRLIYSRSFQSICEDLKPDYVILRHPTQTQKLAIAPQEKGQEVMGLIKQTPDVAVPSGVAPSLPLDRIHRALISAFQQQPSPDSGVWFSLVEPFRFERIPHGSPVPSDKVIVEAEYLLGVENPKPFYLMNSEEMARLRNSVQNWLRRHNLPAERFFFKRKGAATGIGKTMLERLIESQPEDIRDRLLIPADIAKLLLAK